MSEKGECVHDWQRVENRDRSCGPMPDGRVGKSWLVFWCPKCAATTTECVDFDEAARSTARPALSLAAQEVGRG